MSAYSDLLADLRRARSARDAAREAVHASRLEILTLTREQRKALRGELSQDDRSEDLEAVRRRLEGEQRVLRDREARVSSLVEGLFERGPEQLIGEWDDATPILLLPLRVETKFKTVQGRAELWVRVFPDEVAVTTHEAILTTREYKAGLAYWKALRAATDDERRATAWRDLADDFGGNRSAWIALQTKPRNWSTPPPASDDDLDFPTPEVTKPDSWSQAPHSLVMPDRLMLLLYRGGVAVKTVVGNTIADRLVLGPAPLDDEAKASIGRTADQRLEYGEDFRWIQNVADAETRGMAFFVPLNPDDAQGFDQLVVLGLKHSTDEKDGQALLEALIENHHYSAKGFSLVKQGTATNNTDGRDAGFTRADWLHDTSAFVETGPDLFAIEADAARARDGQRLAEYLGIRYEVLTHIYNSDGLDHADAVAMNRALYGATLGYYVDSMLNDVMTRATTRRLREFFTDHVTGRGPVATVRVGNQPYGILVTSAGPAWNFPAHEIREAPIDVGVHRAAMRARQAWRTLAQQLAQIGKGGDSRQALMKVLGLQPTSADYYHRVGYSYDYLANLEDFAWGGRYFIDVLMMLSEGTAVRQLLQDLGYNPRQADGTLKPSPLLAMLIFRHYQSRLDRGNLVDGLPLAEDRGIKPYDTGTGANYIDWLLAHASDVDALEGQNFGTGITAPNALLYLMLHNALLQEIRSGIHALFESQAIQSDELIRSRKFMNVMARPDVSPWEVFRAPATRILAGETSTNPLLAYVQDVRFTRGDSAEIGRYVQQQKEALQHLRNASTARLERALAEHIDTLSYRLDSWETALFDRRLRSQRQLGAEQRRTGILLGSYGYLEDVRPSNSRVRVADDTLPAPLREGTDNLFIENGNGGYVHAPSLNHATAAAVLRSGYLTHASPADREKLSVNLSSERVRRAKSLIDGVRNGQGLEVLLGYLFERGLHEWTTRAVNPVILDHLKPLFRATFPIKRTRLPRQGFSEPAQTIDDFQVTNGLDLAQLTTGFPYGITFSPALDASQIAAIETEKRNIEDSLDALRDLLTAESAYQLALGNFDRAAAVTQAIANGQMPVEIDVINSSRGTAIGFTTRVTMHFDPALAANPWPGVVMTARALVEPSINHWIGRLLGDPVEIRCAVRAVDEHGVTLTDGGGTPIEGIVSLRDLVMQPLDFVYLIRRKVDPAGGSELENRVRYAFARSRGLSDSTLVHIAFADAGPGGTSVRSFAEILPLADGVRELIGRARPLLASDYATPSKLVTAPPDNPGNINVSELRARVVALRAGFDALFATLAAADTQAALGTPVAIDALRDAITFIADAGFVHSFPVSTTDVTVAARDALVAQSQSLQSRYTAVTTAHDADLAVVDLAATRPPQQLTLLVGMARRFVGDDYVVLPRFTLPNASEMGQADAHRVDLLTHANSQGVALPVEEWLHGASLVRPTLHLLASVRIYADTFGAPDVPFLALQLPYRINDSWLATVFPETLDIVHDTIAVAQYLPQGFSPAGTMCGLLVDEWIETLPRREEVTGIAFNYNQPNSMPPSAILLAVTPQPTGHWQWDHLAATVLDTFERARLRAVEPDMLDTLAGFGTLLPATLAEFSTGKNSIALDYLFNVAEVYQAATASRLRVDG
jgi:hypothetical protein